MISAPRTRWFAAALAVAALTAGACTNQDASKKDVLNALEDADVDKKDAECVADDLDAQLDQDQLNDLSKADDLADVSQDLRDKVDATIAKCGVGNGGEGGEPTTTAPPEETTTTAAP